MGITSPTISVCSAYNILTITSSRAGIIPRGTVCFADCSLDPFVIASFAGLAVVIIAVGAAGAVTMAQLFDDSVTIVPRDNEGRVAIGAATVVVLVLVLIAGTTVAVSVVAVPIYTVGTAGTVRDVRHARQYQQ